MIPATQLEPPEEESRGEGQDDDNEEMEEVSRTQIVDLE